MVIAFSRATAGLPVITTGASVGVSDQLAKSTVRNRALRPAAVVAMEPEVLLLDEATNGLDTGSHARLTELLRGLPQAMAFVSHDERLIASLATRAVLMQAGRLADASLHAHPHRHVHAHPHLHVQGDAGENHGGSVHELTHDHGAENLHPPDDAEHRQQGM